MKKRNKDKKKRPRTVMEHISENTETIVIAVILAVLVRAFVLEAFQIPTGSMAPGLCGVHMNVECPNCGYAYNVGGTPGDYGLAGTGGPAAEGLQAMACPLCSQVPGSQDVTPRVGDHIFVNKTLYEARNPRRWEVFVFKYPGSEFDASDRNQELNFIKRCVGLPGDRLQIVDGDLFNHGQILRKPERAQQALWFPLFDSAYPWQQQVNDRPAWRLLGRREVVLPTVASPGPITVRNSGPDSVTRLVFNREVDDHLIYNGYNPRVHRESVSDVALELRLVALERAGSVEIELDADKAARPDGWSAGRLAPDEIPSYRRLRVKLDLAGGTGTMTLGDDDSRRATFDIDATASVLVRLENVDYLATLRLDGQQVAAIDYWPGQSVEKAHRREVNYDGNRYPMRQPRLRFRGVKADLETLKLWRDIYYINQGRSSMDLLGQDGAVIVLHKPGEVITLEDGSTTVSQGEFFALGDNSTHSRDSRMWGRVPRQNILGRAMIVWPWLHSTRLKVIR